MLRRHYYPYYYNLHFTSAANTDTGFRPMLLVEQLVINKYLIEQNSKYYTINPELVLLDISDLSQENFNNYRFDNLNKLTEEIKLLMKRY